ncbi:transposase [Paenactinomyces guangxiensis]|uniref:Transposase n=1 Tax=Paenactinomyces guangxiensis TaxID=1490290 RepID=A0A7W2A5Z5_9BACL|nr:transposase [Paenactinomyces guangxiensis]MBH8590310.1 transposase [Paenactinomyces guangxiensis]
MTDQQWEIIEPLPPVKKTNMGRPPAEPGKTLNGRLYVLNTDCPWAIKVWFANHLLAKIATMDRGRYMRSHLACSSFTARCTIENIKKQGGSERSLPCPTPL